MTYSKKKTNTKSKVYLQHVWCVVDEIYLYEQCFALLNQLAHALSCTRAIAHVPGQRLGQSSRSGPVSGGENVTNKSQIKTPKSCNQNPLMK